MPYLWSITMHWWAQKNLITLFWEVELISDVGNLLNKDQEVKKFFCDQTKRNYDGIYTAQKN